MLTVAGGNSSVIGQGDCCTSERVLHKVCVPGAVIAAAGGT